MDDTLNRSGPDSATDWIVHPHWHNFPPLSITVHQVFAVIGIIIFIVSLVGNVTVLFLFTRFRSLRSSSNLLVLNLTVADFVLAVGNIPMFITSSLHGRWVFGILGCHLYASVGTISSLVSINTLTAIAVDRCLVIVKTLPLQRNSSRKRFICVILVIWGYSGLWTLVPFLGWGRYILEGSGTSCTFDFFSRTTNVQSYVFVISVLNFGIPIVVITSSYALIFITVAKHQTLFKDASKIYGENDTPLRMRTHNSEMRKEAKTARVSLTVISVFCVSWLPYAIVAVIGIFGDASVITPIAAAIPCFCAKFSTSINPIIYALLHPKFRMKLSYYGRCSLATEDVEILNRNIYLRRTNTRQLSTSV